MIKFGTDGWRAVISEEFTFENVRKVTQAFADYFSPMERKKPVVIGYDTRFLSEEFAKAAAEVLAANGRNVLLMDEASPTPMVSFTIKKKKLPAGIMITASHNPPKFNGFKIKAAYAGSADEDITKAVEKLVGKKPVKALNFATALKEGKVKLINMKREYVNFLSSYIKLSYIQKKKFNVLVDVMHGTANRLIEEIVNSRTVKITTIRHEFNPSFGGVNPEPIVKNLKMPIKMMKQKGYDIALITDGDADRSGAIAPGGRFINPGWIMALLLIHFVEDRNMREGMVVKTISNSTLIELITRKYNLRLHEVPVGFKYICKLMRNEKVLLGGEESGGIGFPNYLPERDGILTGLLLLEMMAYRKKSILKIIDEVEKEYGHFYYSRLDVVYPDKYKKKLFNELKSHPFSKVMNKDVVEVKDFDGVKFILKDNSWLLFRLSGTEPILRIYSEAGSQKKVDEILSFGKDFALSKRVCG
jgi:alpha-D-glucose phosphate-specific phosphoglucomutase